MWNEIQKYLEKAGLDHKYAIVLDHTNIDKVDKISFGFVSTRYGPMLVRLPKGQIRPRKGNTNWNLCNRIDDWYSSEMKNEAKMS